MEGCNEYKYACPLFFQPLHVTNFNKSMASVGADKLRPHPTLPTNEETVSCYGRPREGKVQTQKIITRRLFPER